MTGNNSSTTGNNSSKRNRKAIDYNKLNNGRSFFATTTVAMVATAIVLNANTRKILASTAKSDAEKAIISEFKQLTADFKAWKYLQKETDREPSIHKKVERCMMIMKEKLDAEGHHIKWKARLTNCNTTNPNNYSNTDKSAPTVSYETFLMQLAIAQSEGMQIESFDVPGAYLHGELEKGKKHIMRIEPFMTKYLIQADPKARKT